MLGVELTGDKKDKWSDKKICDKGIVLYVFHHYWG